MSLAMPARAGRTDAVPLASTGAPADIRLLTFSTLYPSSARPVHGLFVETRLRELLKSGRVQARVVAPVPWFPSRHPRWGSHAALAATPEAERRDGIDVLHPRYALLPKVGMSSAPLMLALGALPTLRRLIAQGQDFDILDAHYFYPDGVAAALLGRWLRKPVVITARGSDINLIPDHAIPRRWIDWAALQAAACIGVSAALVARMQALGFDRAKLRVVRNGVDLARFQPMDRQAARAELGLPGAAPLLLCVGNVHEHKGQGLAIEALALLRQQQADAELLIIGAGPDEARFRALAQSLGVADAVRWIGTVDNAGLPRWYSAADALVLASSREGWPNVLLEAMACGCPVVATDVGGVREIITRPVAGQVAAERTAAAVAGAAQQLLVHRRAPAAVRAHASEFGWAHTTAEQLALFDQLLRPERTNA